MVMYLFLLLGLVVSRSIEKVFIYEARSLKEFCRRTFRGKGCWPLLIECCLPALLPPFLWFVLEFDCCIIRL